MVGLRLVEIKNYIRRNVLTSGTYVGGVTASESSIKEDVFDSRSSDVTSFATLHWRFYPVLQLCIEFRIGPGFLLARAHCWLKDRLGPRRHSEA